LDEKLRIDLSLHSERGMAYDQLNRGNFLWHWALRQAGAALDAALSWRQKERTEKQWLALVHMSRARMAVSQLVMRKQRRKPNCVGLSQKFLDVALQQSRVWDCTANSGRWRRTKRVARSVDHAQT